MYSIRLAEIDLMKMRKEEKKKLRRVCMHKFIVFLRDFYVKCTLEM